MATTWQKTAHDPRPALSGSHEADVVIVGGGITGTTAAYILAKAGKKVIVIDKGTLAQSVTAYTTAFLTCEIDTDLSDLKKIFGSASSRLIWQSGEEAIQAIETIIKEEDIDCEFTRCPEYIFARSAHQWKLVEEEAAAAKALGFHVEIRKNGFLPFADPGYALLPNQAKFHPLKYVAALRQRAEAEGALFFEHTRAIELAGDAPVTVLTQSGSVSAPWVIIATYNPFNKSIELYAHKGMYISYIMELAVPKKLLQEGLYIDAQNPYHYFRLDPGENEDRLIIGGEDHRKEIPMNPEKNFGALENYAKKILGKVTYRIITRWSGPILETWDGLPFIGAYSKKYPARLVATGFSGNGMTYAMTAALILADTIQGKKNKYADIFSPKRGYSFRAAFIKGRDYLEEFIFGSLVNFFRSKK